MGSKHMNQFKRISYHFVVTLVLMCEVIGQEKGEYKQDAKF